MRRNSDRTKAGIGPGEGRGVKIGERKLGLELRQKVVAASYRVLARSGSLSAWDMSPR
jgi:hypothetical protein